MSSELAITLVKYGVMFLVFLNVAPIMNWVERRACAFIQDRPGPNRVGPFGLFQPLADVVEVHVQGGRHAGGGRQGCCT